MVEKCRGEERELHLDLGRISDDFHFRFGVTAGDERSRCGEVVIKNLGTKFDDGHASDVKARLTIIHI